MPIAPNAPMPRRTLAAASLVLLLLTAPDPGAAQPAYGGLEPAYEGDLYEIASDRRKLLYRYVVAETPDSQHRRATFTTPEGTLAASEEVRMQEGALVSYTVVHPEAGRSASIRRVGDRVVFSYTADGETRTGSEPWRPDVVVGPMLAPLMRTRWKQLAAGETVELRLAVADRRTTYRFDLFRSGERRVGGRPAVEITFEPSSFLLAVLVDPIVFAMSPDGSTVYEILGRTTPLRNVGGRWKPTDADGVYTKLR